MHLSRAYFLCISHRRVSQRRTFHGRAHLVECAHFTGCAHITECAHLRCVSLIGVYLMSVPPTDVSLMSVHLTGVHLTGVHLTGVPLAGVPLTGVFTGVHGGKRPNFTGSIYDSRAGTRLNFLLHLGLQPVRAWIKRVLCGPKCHGKLRRKPPISAHKPRGCRLTRCTLQ